MNTYEEKMSELKTKVYNTITEINKNQWNNIIKQSKLGGFFHRYEWLKSVEKGIGLDAKHIVIFKNGNPIGIFPNFVIKIEKTPFKRLYSLNPGSGGPVISKQEGKVMDLLLKKSSYLCGGKIISHNISTHNFGYTRYGQYFEKKGYRLVIDGCRFYIDLDNKYEDIQSKMYHQRRREIKKISKKNYEIKEININEQNLLTFYKIYKENLKNNNINAFPFDFFSNLNKEIGKNMKIFRAIVEEKSVGEVLCFIDNENLVIHGFFSAINNNNFKFYPWVLLNDYVIRWGKNNNFLTYDLGDTPANFNDNIFRYKESFGGKIFPTISWEKSYSKIRWKLYDLGRSLYRKKML